MAQRGLFTRIRTRRAAMVAAGGLVLGGMVAVPVAMAAPPTSNFEIDEDANLTQDDQNKLDWLSSSVVAAATVKKDKDTGKTDDSYSGGVKEDTECPSETTGSIPNNKSDLRTFRVFVEEGSGDHPGWLNIAWSRVTDPSGTTLMDFEFNQSKEACAEGPNRVRTQGDLLIEYLIDQGGARANITLRTWTGTAWGPSESITEPSDVCGGEPCAVGTINSSSISAANSGLVPGEPLAPRTFGEARIDLRTIFKSNKCESFGSAMLKSRSSDSFTSQLKDFIAPEDINLTNCGTVIIRKQTDPDGASGSFSFTKAFSTDSDKPDTFNLEDDGVETFDKVLFGTGLTVTESSLATGFELKSIDCSASKGVTPSVSLEAETVTFDIDQATDVLDCTYTNRAKAKLTIKKVVDPSTSTTAFTFTPGQGLPTDPATFSLSHNGTKVFDDLAPGTKTVTETVPSGWESPTIACTRPDGPDDGTDPDPVANAGTSPAATVTLLAGDDVTCTFTNTLKPRLTLVKVLVDTVGGGAAATDWTLSATGASTISGATGAEAVTAAKVNAGSYALSESGPTEGYTASAYSCIKNGADAVVGNSITLANGDVATCTITNTALANDPVISTVQRWILHDSFTATIRPGAPDASSADVTFKLFKDDPNCAAENQVGIAEVVDVTLSADGKTASAATVSGFPVTESGTYFWKVTYDGDQYNSEATSGCSAEITQILAKDAFPPNGRDDFPPAD